MKLPSLCIVKVIRIEILHRIGERVQGSDCKIGMRIISSYFPIKKNI